MHSFDPNNRTWNYWLTRSLQTESEIQSEIDELKSEIDDLKKSLGIPTAEELKQAELDQFLRSIAPMQRVLRGIVRSL